MKWMFPSGADITFAYIERDDNVYDWQGSELALIEFDELTHFSEFQFFYMLSRNRSMSGIKPYVRASCNPDAESWVAKFISWWIDQDTGYAIPERSGKIRYCARVNEILTWGDTKEEVLAQATDELDIDINDIKSVSFVASSLHDNKILMETNPGYLANLKSLSIVERERLLYGNWKIKAAAGLYFKRSQVTIIDELPTDVKQWVRAWDLAASEKTEGNEPAFTAGVLMGKRRNGNYVVVDVINQRLKAGAVRELIKTTAKSDKAKYGRVKIRLPQDPGQAGKEQAESYIKFLAGFSVVAIRESGTKESRAEPFAAQWQGLENADKGNVELLAGEWNEIYLGQLEAFPDAKFKDMVDASSSAFNELEKTNVSVGPSENAINSLNKSSYWNR